jgi:hypothetical protein
MRINDNEVALALGEKLPRHLNVLGIVVWAKIEDGWHIAKHADTILETNDEILEAF